MVVVVVCVDDVVEVDVEVVVVVVVDHTAPSGQPEVNSKLSKSAKPEAVEPLLKTPTVILSKEAALA